MLRIALFLVVVSAAASPTAAKTWYLDANGTGDAPTIDAAFQSAIPGEGRGRTKRRRDLRRGSSPTPARSWAPSPPMTGAAPGSRPTQAWLWRRSTSWGTTGWSRSRTAAGPSSRPWEAPPAGEAATEEIILVR